MGLETATFISGLTDLWPLSSETKSQGDDHLRLIKQVLKGTFPNASKAFSFPGASTGSGGGATYNLQKFEQNTTLIFDTTAGNAQVLLPAGMVVGDAGWSCSFIKLSTADQNGIVVVPGVGTITSQFGSVASIRVGATACEAKLFWSGITWYCLKQGPLIGSTISFDGPTIPAGHLVLDGSTFSSAVYPELYLANGSSTTLRDKRGRVEAGVDSGANRLTAGADGFATAAILGAVGGFESNTLDLTRIPSHSHANTLTNGTHSHSIVNMTAGGIYSNNGNNAGTPYYFPISPPASTATSSDASNVSITNANAGSGGAHKNVQPTIVTQKLIRAC